jgi:alanine racemase
MEEAVELSATMGGADHGITLLMSSMARTERANDPHAEHQIALFNELRRLYHGIPTSLAGATAILLDPRTHFDLVRADSALFGINPVPGSANPMLPVIELTARIVQVRNTTPERNFFNKGPKRRRLAFVSIGHADGFPRSWHPKAKLYAIVDGHRCPVTAPSSVDVLAIDVTDLPDDRAAGSGEMATLIGSTMTIDEVAEATRSTGQEVLTALGNRFHRTYYAT